MRASFKYVLLFLIGGLLNLPIVTKAYQLNGVKWASGAYNYYINPIGVDNSVNYSAYTNTVINATSEWETVGTTDVQLNYLGTTTNEDWGINDGQNVVTWKTNGWTGNVIGTSVYWYSGNNIIDSDIKLNTAFADDSRLPQLVTHEVGHSLGIGHTREEGESYSPDEYDAIMYYLLHSQTELNGEDKCAITAIYPASTDCKPDYGTGYFNCISCCSTGVVVSAQITDNIYTYDGTSKSATVTVSPSGFSNTVGYFDQQSNPVASPTDAGTYDVVVTITESGYESEGPFYGTLTINKKELTVSADDQVVNYGDDEPAYTLNFIGFVNSETESDLTTVPSGHILSSWPVDPGSYVIYVNYGVDDNYSFNYSYGTLTVNSRSVNGVQFSDKIFVYDGTNKIITVTTDPDGLGYTIEYQKDGNAATENINAGNYLATITINETGYNADQFTDTLIITKVDLTVSVNDTTIDYGEPEPDYTIIYNGFVNGETESVLSTLPSAYISERWPVIPGSYAIHIDSGNDENYNFTYVEGALIINSLFVDRLIFSDKQYIYDGTSKEITIATVLDSIGYNVEYRLNESIVSDQTDAGIYTVTVSINETGYVSEQFSDSLIIEKKMLNVSAKDTTIVFGDSKPEAVIFYSGFESNDSVNDLTVLPTVDIPGIWPLLPGNYEITISNGFDENYIFALTNGTLTVLPNQIDSILFENLNYTFDGKIHKATISTYPEEIETSMSYYDSINNLVNDPVDAGSYTIEAVVTEPGYKQDTVHQMLTIDKALLLVSVANDSIIEGDPEPVFSISYNGFINGDDSTVIDVLPQASIDGIWPLAPDSYTIEISGGMDNNYDFAYINGTLTIVATYLVKILASENGWISLSEDGVRQDSIWENVIANENSSSYYAIPDNNYKFKSWDNGNTENPVSFYHVNEDTSILAIFESIVGISELDNNDFRIKVYPNPVYSRKWSTVNIGLPETHSASVKLLVSDALGKIVFQTILYENKVNLPPLSPGVYNLSFIYNGKRMAMSKLLVK